MCNKVFEFFYRTATHVEDGNFRLNTIFMEHSSIASLANNQKKRKKKSQILQPSPQMLPPVSGDQ